MLPVTTQLSCTSSAVVSQQEQVSSGEFGMSAGALWNTACFDTSMQCIEPLSIWSQADSLTHFTRNSLISEIILVWFFFKADICILGIDWKMFQEFFERAHICHPLPFIAAWSVNGMKSQPLIWSPLRNKTSYLISALDSLSSGTPQAGSLFCYSSLF